METKTDNQEIANFEFRDILPIGLTLVVTVIGLSYGADITSDIDADFSAGTAEKNVTTQGLQALNKLSSKLPMIMTIIVAAIVISILIRYLSVNYAR